MLASTYPRWLGDHEPGFVHELAKRLTKNFNVFVITPHSNNAKKHEILEGVTVFRYQYAPRKLQSLVNNGGIVTNLKNSPWKLLLLPFFFIAQLLLIRKIIKRESIDIVHAHWLIPQGLALALLSKIMKVPPLLTTSHGADLFALQGKLFNFLKIFVVKQSVQLSVVSQAMKAELIKLGVDENKVDVMPMGVDINKFNINPNITRASNEILFVGRLVEKKGLSNLIDALPSILRKHPTSYLSIIGFGPEELKLKAQAQKLNIENKVNFIGAVNQNKLAKHYQSATVFVAPFVETKSGDQEGLGLVLVEALACGCPVVVSDIPACKDVIDGMSNVEIFPSKDIQSLSEAVNLSITKNNNDPKVNTQILNERFSWQAVAQNYNNKLEAIISHDPRY